MKTKFKIFENQHPKIIEYSKVLDSYWPFKYFSTLSYQYPFSDRKGVEYATQHIVRFNGHLNNLNIDDKKHRPITGIAVLEHTKLKKIMEDGTTIKDLGNCHFHFLLHDHPYLDKDPNVGLRQVRSAWDKSARSLNYKRNRKLVSKNGTMTQLFQTKGIYGYVLKEAKDFNWKYQERVFLLDNHGLIPIDFSNF